MEKRENGLMFLPFEGIGDLLRRVEEVKEAYKLDSLIFKDKLKGKLIDFDELDEYGVAVDFTNLSEGDKAFVVRATPSYVDKVFKELGIVSKRGLFDNFAKRW